MGCNWKNLDFVDSISSPEYCPLTCYNLIVLGFYFYHHNDNEILNIADDQARIKFSDLYLSLFTDISAVSVWCYSQSKYFSVCVSVSLCLFFSLSLCASSYYLPFLFTPISGDFSYLFDQAPIVI